MSLNLPSPAPFSRRQDLVRIAVLLFFLFLIAVGAVPHYLKGQWSGSQPLKVEGLKALQEFAQGQLQIPGWESSPGEKVKIGELEWVQHILRSGQSEPTEETSPEAIVLLRGQKWSEDRPQVEWTDLKGDQRWTEDQVATLQVGTTTVRWFRAWWETDSGTILTMAVAQWYAWPAPLESAQAWSGHWSSNAWFWQNWQSQWQRDKKPWMAIVVMIPIEPLGDIVAVEPQARSVVEELQTALGQLL
jgi:cyanoexosortase B-associated protein